jgi:hypothetical protein
VASELLLVLEKRGFVPIFDRQTTADARGRGLAGSSAAAENLPEPRVRPRFFFLSSRKGG